MARPSKFTPERRQRILGAIRAGSFAEAAAEFGGISASTFYEWLERGRGGDARYAKFAEEVRQASAEAEVRHASQISKAGQSGDWRASAFWLSRARRERWGRVVPTAEAKERGGLSELFERIRRLARARDEGDAGSRSHGDGDQQ